MKKTDVVRILKEKPPLRRRNFAAGLGIIDGGKPSLEAERRQYIQDWIGSIFDQQLLFEWTLAFAMRHQLQPLLPGKQRGGRRWPVEFDT